MKQHFFRKTSLAIAALALALTQPSFGQKTKYTITGQIKDLPDGTKMELVPGGTHKNEKPVAATLVKGGKFIFTGSLSSPRYFYVKLAAEDYSMFPLMVENSDIRVTGAVKARTQDGSTVHDFSNIKISGSKVHAQYLEKTSLRQRLDLAYEAYHEKNKAILEKVEGARKQKDTVLAKQLLASDAYKQFEKDEGAFFKSVEDSVNTLILAHKDSWWGPFLMLNNLNYFRPEEKNTFEQFSKAAKESYYGKVVAAELYPVSLVGQMAPSLAFSDDQAFASLTKGKRYVVVDFWASWCVPCRKAVPALKQFYAESSSNGVEIISVSIDKKEADWVKANNEEKFPWHSFLDRKGLADAYNVKAIPAMFLLDEKGKVVAENVSLEEIKAKIK